MRTLYRSLLLLTGLLLVAACGSPYQYNGTMLDPPQRMPDFTLSDQHGQPFQLSAQQGVTLLYFGFTNCPDYCPTTMGTWKQVKQELGAAAENVQFVMVTVDPENDTPETLGSYLARFDEAFIGLRPTPEQLADLNEGYWLGLRLDGGQSNVDTGAHADHAEHDAQDAPAASHNTVDHGTHVYVIDQQQLRLLFRPDHTPQQITSDIKALLGSS